MVAAAVVLEPAEAVVATLAPETVVPEELEESVVDPPTTVLLPDDCVVVSFPLPEPQIPLEQV